MADGVPLKYKIHLEPDLERLRFDGSAEILLECETPIREISLNALDLAVWRCRVVVEGTSVSCPFSVDPQKEELRVVLPREMTGGITLQIDYVGEINNRMAGFYRSTYSQGGVAGTMAVTQFEESDARRALPCFDHPAKKAVFELEMVIDRGLTAISNESVLEETTLEDGRKRVRFRETPRMSTYLLFFGVGPFEISEEPGKVLLRLAARPGMTPYGDYALDFARKALLYSRGVLRGPLSPQQTGPDRRVGFCFWGHGELGCHHLPGEPAPAGPGKDFQGRGGADLRGDRPRDGPPVVREPGDTGRLEISLA